MSIDTSPSTVSTLPTHLTNGAEGPSAELKAAVQEAKKKFDEPTVVTESDDKVPVDPANAHEGAIQA